MKPSTFIQTILLLSLVFLLNSCGPSSIGRKFDVTHVNDIENRVTTKETIRQWFGEPYAKGAVNPEDDPELWAKGCVDSWIYLYAYLLTSESLAVSFDADGKVCTKGYKKKN